MPSHLWPERVADGVALYFGARVVGSPQNDRNQDKLGEDKLTWVFRHLAAQIFFTGLFIGQLHVSTPSRVNFLSFVSVLSRAIMAVYVTTVKTTFILYIFCWILNLTFSSFAYFILTCIVREMLISFNDITTILFHHDES